MAEPGFEDLMSEDRATNQDDMDDQWFHEVAQRDGRQLQ
jgi:hypothetical protein